MAEVIKLRPGIKPAASCAAYGLCRHRAGSFGRTFIRCLAARRIKKCSPYSIAERRVPKLIPVLGSQPAGDASHIPGGTLPLLYARPTDTLATLKMAATSFAAW